MAFASQPSASDGDRDPAASGTRRQLLSRRGSHDTPPRVVLHLPDLEALSTVALGPPQPAARRRIDPSHTPIAVPIEPYTTASDSPSLLKLLKIPVAKFLAKQSHGDGVSIGKLLVMLQQPKMLLAAVLAIGLQLAAVLAMLTGGSKPKTEAVVGKEPAVSWPLTSPTPSNSTVQTPLSLPSFAPSGVAAAPTLPPPQTLPGLDTRDLPPWPSDATSSQASSPPVANQPARLTSPSPVMPTPAPPREDKPVAGTPTLELPSPVTSAPAGSIPAITAAQSSDAGSSRPKARLQGTIKKTSAGGVAK